MSLFTEGVVAGSESLSAPVWFVIVKLLSLSNSFEIHATFVNTFLFDASGFCVTSHSISIVSELRLPSEYACKLSVLLAFLVNVNLLSPVSLYEPNSKFPLTTFENFSPVGNWSTISSALPAFCPSLYIVNLYVT